MKANQSKTVHLPTTQATPVEDHILLQLLQQRQTRDRGFRLLVDQYGERLYAQVRRLVIEHDDANDVLQNALVKIYRNIDRFKEQSRLYTWMYRIATNEALDWLEQQKRRRALSLEDEAQWVGDTLAGDQHFDGDAAQRHLHMAIATLPPKQRAVFNLRYFEEMSYREMSEVLATSEGALKASYHHATRKVEDYLSKQMSQ